MFFINKFVYLYSNFFYVIKQNKQVIILNQNIKKMKKNLIYSILLFIVINFFYACNDAPTEVGMGFLQDTASINIIAGKDNSFFTSCSTYTVKSKLNLGGILVGEAKNMKAASFISFVIPIGLDSTITEDKIVECKLYIYPRNYAIGDITTNLLSFEIKEITNRWDVNETTADEVFGSNNFFENGKIISNWSGQLERKDTMDALVFDFPKDLCAEWLEKWKDYQNIVDTVWGLAIMPRAGSTIINDFVAYSSTSEGSHLKVKFYKNEELELDSFSVHSAIDKKFVQLNEDISQDDLTIQGSVKIHSRINFDVSSIPDLAIIHYVELTLFVNDAKSYFGNLNKPETISLSLYLDLEKEAESPNAMIIGRYDSTNNTFNFKDILYIPFNKFLRSDTKNGTLVLSFEIGKVDELNYLNRYVFHGINDPDINKRPKLKIVYSSVE